MSRYQRYVVIHGGMIQHIRACSWHHAKREMARIYGADFKGIDIELGADGVPRATYKFDDGRWLYKATELREE